MQAVSISGLKHHPAEALRQAKAGPVVVLYRDRPDALLIGLEQGGLLQAPGVRAAQARLNGLEWLKANETPRLCRTVPTFSWGSLPNRAGCWSRPLNKFPESSCGL